MPYYVMEVVVTKKFIVEADTPEEAHVTIGYIVENDWERTPAEDYIEKIIDIRDTPDMDEEEN